MMMTFDMLINYFIFSPRILAKSIQKYYKSIKINKILLCKITHSSFLFTSKTKNEMRYLFDIEHQVTRIQNK